MKDAHARLTLMKKSNVQTESKFVRAKTHIFHQHFRIQRVHFLWFFKYFCSQIVPYFSLFYHGLHVQLFDRILVEKGKKKHNVLGIQRMKKGHFPNPYGTQRITD